MRFDPEIHRRRSVRLRGYDYAAAGAYFVTICVQGRACLLGDIAAGVMQPSAAGRTVAEIWQSLPTRFQHLVLDECVAMPNHFHGLIGIHDVGAGSPRPDSPEQSGGVTPPLRKPTLGQIVGYFKYQTTKQIDIMRDNPGVPVWQRNYYERIVRDEDELARTRRYIADNPAQWQLDAENPANLP